MTDVRASSDAVQRRRSEAWWFGADALLAALFTWITVVSLRSPAYVDQYGAVTGAGWVLALAPNALLLVRRLAPVTVLIAATALYLAASASHGDSNAPLAIPFFAYSVARARPIRASGAIVGSAALAMSTTTFYGPGEPDALVIVVWFLLYGLGWVAGVSVARTEKRAVELTRTVDDLEAQQEEIAASAIAEERTRIARELHDAVGHTVNVIVLQAGAARLSHDPDKALEALAAIEGLGRNALVDLDHMLGLMDEAEAARSPLKGFADVTSMIEELRAAGADIAVRDTCDRPIGRHEGVAAYRIVQESLTNALKHAPDAHVDVLLSCSPGWLHVAVINDGAGSQPRSAISGGRGIVGMTERAKVLGGHLQAGPVAGGGFEIRATLPLSPILVPSLGSEKKATR